MSRRLFSSLAICVLAISAGCSAAAAPGSSLDGRPTRPPRPTLAPEASPAPLPSEPAPSPIGTATPDATPVETAPATPGPTAVPEATAEPTPAATPTPRPTHAATPRPTLVPPAGKTHYEDAVAGFSLDLPGGWIGFIGDDLDDLDEVASQVPELAAYLEDLQASALDFVGVDVDPTALGNGFGTNVTIVTLGSAVPVRALEATAVVVAEGLEETLHIEGDISIATVALPGGDAVKLTFRYTVQNEGGQQVTLYGEEYLLVMGDHTFAVTFTTLADLAGDYKPVFKKIAESLRPA